ncbi:hypothetical protein GJ496_009287 [Pomphorhynchus laevis]|nr:hypothetical protein GJ496_009287 [Pomphorhynchus laevis]
MFLDKCIKIEDVCKEAKQILRTCKNCAIIVMCNPSTLQINIKQHIKNCTISDLKKEYRSSNPLIVISYCPEGSNISSKLLNAAMAKRMTDEMGSTKLVEIRCYDDFDIEFLKFKIPTMCGFSKMDSQALTHCEIPGITIMELAVVNDCLVVSLKDIKNPKCLTRQVGSKIFVRVQWIYGKPGKIIYAELITDQSKKQSTFGLSHKEDKITAQSLHYRVGRVSIFNKCEQSGNIDNFINFSINHCLDGYTPAVDDWVQVEVNKDNEVQKICPNRIGQIIGKLRWYYYSKYSIKSADKVIGTIASCALFSTEENPEFKHFTDNLTFFANVIERFQVANTSLLGNDPSYHENRWKSRYSWRVVQAVPLDDFTFVNEEFTLEGSFYWSITEFNRSNVNSFKLMSKLTSVKELTITIEPKSCNTFKISEYRLNDDQISSTFEVVCQSVNNEHHNFANIVIVTANKTYKYLIMYQSEFNFDYPLRLVNDVENAGRIRLREYDDAKDSRSQGDKVSMVKGRRVPPLYTKGSVLYYPPKRIKDLYMENISKNTDMWTLICNEHPDMMRPLNAENYSKKFHFLLHLEQIAREIQAFSIPELPVIFKKEEQCFTFEWPYEDEGVINIFYNDKIIVDGRHDGFVNKMDGSTISVKFNRAFHNSYKSNQVCRIRVVPNESTYRRCHEAIHQASMKNIPNIFTVENCIAGDNLIQFNSNSLTRLTDTSNFEWFNTKLNPEQKQAVVCMLSPASNSKCLHPFVLFGPPGTGKTITLVEAIEQSFNKSKCSKILACAPSNAAADVICSKLVATGRYSPIHVGRLYAHSRSWDHVPDEIKPFALMLSGSGSTEGDVLVNDCDLARRILITTFVCSSQLRLSNGRQLVFSHVFLDECAQASEPEALIPIIYSQNYGKMGDSSGVVALAGDPFQLGPVLISAEAQRLGLNISLLERLFSCKYCNIADTRKSRIVYLRSTYRFLHKELIEIPSMLFYNRSLIVETNHLEQSTEIEYVCNKRLSPVVFVNVEESTCHRGADSLGFSLYNETETVIVCKEVIAALEGKQYNSIGVITPYRAQVKKIKALLSELLEAMDNCVNKTDDLASILKIGSVEEFQGSEYDLIIISTVRTSQCTSITFISNPKRFNVALTRARKRMIVIGCYDALISNINWLHFINYAQNLASQA